MRNEAFFRRLRSMTCAQLAELGCRRWDDSGLMLFPAEWFNDVPAGYPVVNIFGQEVPFATTFSRDRRYGMLSFGVIGREAARRDPDAS